MIIFKYILITLILSTFHCKKNITDHSLNAPAGSCLRWQSQRIINFDITEREFAEYLDIVYIRHKAPPDSQFGPRMLAGRIDGYKIARSQVFKGRLFTNNDIVCQINDFNLMKTCANENLQVDQRCWDDQANALSKKLSDLAHERSNLVGSQAKLQIYRNDIPATLIIKIVH